MSELSLQAYRKDPNSYSHIKDPVSTLTHFIGFILSIFSTPLLLSKAGIRHSDIVIMVGLSIYCLSMIVLYGASSAYHAFLLPEKGMKILRKIDHISTVSHGQCKICGFSFIHALKPYGHHKS